MSDNNRRSKTVIAPEKGLHAEPYHLSACLESGCVELTEGTFCDVHEEQQRNKQDAVKNYTKGA